MTADPFLRYVSKGTEFLRDEILKRILWRFDDPGQHNDDDALDPGCDQEVAHMNRNLGNDVDNTIAR
jgi:sigma54-dependent transcription regulator